ncbi:type II CAAX endopeptidase family protein [Leifsonia sp. YIM 134122]|uniref:Type II CAAX endopeptidase family protein n=1 Tax=Leifsonia stereocauli TaxID=3134136 RepID=A0ABU9W1T0_9MICO
MSVRDTPFVQDATTGKRVTRWWLSYVLVLVVFILVLPGIVGAVFLQTWKVGPGTPEAQLQEAVTFGAGLLGLFVWVWLFERRRITSLGFRRSGRGILTLLVGLVAGVVLNSIPTLFLWSIGAYQLASPPTGAISGLAGLPILLLVLVFVLVQSGTEETLTRGFMLQSSGVALPGWIAVLLPAVVFTLFHGVTTKPFAFASIFLFALLVTFVVLRQGGLWIAIGIHTGWNFAMGNLYGIPVSGLPPHTASAIFLAPSEGAPDWLTGGEFGTEASLPADLVLGLAAVAAFLVYRGWDRTRTARPEGVLEQESAKH